MIGTLIIFIVSIIAFLILSGNKSNTTKGW
jgi:hypothetical protein